MGEEQNSLKEFVDLVASQFKRPTFITDTAPGGDCDPVSKYGGYPNCFDNGAWPICESCADPMKFLFQLDLSDLQSERSELVQVFHCIDWDCKARKNGNYISAASPCTCVRVQQENIGIVQKNPPEKAVLPCVRIKGWKQKDDCIEGVELLGACGSDIDAPTLHFNLKGRKFSFSDTQSEELMWSLLPTLTVDGDKGLGWPRWLQGPEYPLCTKCNMPMEFVFQMREGVNVAFGGHTGVGYLFLCREHRLGDFVISM